MKHLDRRVLHDFLLGKLGSKVKFTIYPEAKHNSWGKAYRSPELYDWLLERRRKPGKKPTRKAKSR